MADGAYVTTCDSRTYLPSESRRVSNGKRLRAIGNDNESRLGFPSDDWFQERGEKALSWLDLRLPGPNRRDVGKKRVTLMPSVKTDPFAQQAGGDTDPNTLEFVLFALRTRIHGSARIEGFKRSVVQAVPSCS